MIELIKASGAEVIGTQSSGYIAGHVWLVTGCNVLGASGDTSTEGRAETGLRAELRIGDQSAVLVVGRQGCDPAAADGMVGLLISAYVAL